MNQLHQAAPHGLETIRIVSAYDGGFAQVAHLSWAPPTNPGDASLYIRPFIGAGWTAKASVGTAAPNATTTVAAQLQHEATWDKPKLSLHHTGQTHAYVGAGPGYRTQPLCGPRLDDPAGGHVATITCFDLAGLPLLDRPLSADPPHIDFLTRGPGEGTAKLHVSLYSGSDEDAMRERYPFLRSAALLRFDRVGMPKPLFFGLRAVGFPGPPEPPPGVSIVGGWGPGASAGAPIPMVSVWVGPDDADEPGPA